MHLRGHQNMLKRVLLHVEAVDLELLMRISTPGACSAALRRLS